MSKHTPGPWTTRFDFVVQAKSFESGRLVPVAQPYGVNTDGTDLFANARLIAAAPDLLAALIATVKDAEQPEFEIWAENECPAGDAESVHRQWEDSSEYRAFCDHWRAAIDAIAKARGAA